jgi:hypothetical protein
MRFLPKLLCLFRRTIYTRKVITGEIDNLKDELEAISGEEATARQLAVAALEGSSLAPFYPSEYLDELGTEVEDSKEQTQPVQAWIDLAEELLNDDLRTADDIYLALVLVSAEVAREFARVRPEGAGFARICKAFTDRISHEEKERWDERVGREPTLADRDHHPAMARAIESGEAEFSLLSEARSYKQWKFFSNARANRTYDRFYLPVRHAFELAHGRIVEEYWCDEVPFGVVRTTGGAGGSRLHFDGDYGATVSEVINRCKEVHRKAREFLPRQEYDTSVGDLYGLLTDLAATMDAAAALDKEGAVSPKVDREPYLKRVEEVEKDLGTGMARRGQRWYIAGTVFGLVLLALALLLLTLISHGHVQQVLEGAIFGAAGALASVLYRMHRGELAVDAQQGRVLVYIAAVVRPLTGALFGGVITALLLSELLPVKIPDPGDKRFYFLGTLAFVAGLSERWAPDLLQLTADQIAPEVAANPKKQKQKQPVPDPTV